MTRNQVLGSHWEHAAEEFLRSHGLKTVTRNFRCRLGEIDLIMEHGGCLVFTEIRYRRHPQYGSGADTVTRTKQARIIRTAQRYLQLHAHRSRQPCRFDVVSIGEDRGEAAVNWIQNAFTTD